MNWNKTIRQTHRWLSLAFTLTVIICFVALSGALPAWVFYLPLLPLAVLLFTGLCMFFQPYVARRRGGRRVAAEA
ncbi:hypothetical protein [Micromonospora psammae]|uniref:hypothetical protein n=1 Tax=Micromonospora sp. CPCC 205556 TaxID=3122398 RepID=UPI002FF16BF8